MCHGCLFNQSSGIYTAAKISCNIIAMALIGDNINKVNAGDCFNLKTDAQSQ